MASESVSLTSPVVLLTGSKQGLQCYLILPHDDEKTPTSVKGTTQHNYQRTRGHGRIDWVFVWQLTKEQCFSRNPRHRVKIKKQIKNYLTHSTYKSIKKYLPVLVGICQHCFTHQTAKHSHSARPVQPLPTLQTAGEPGGLARRRRWLIKADSLVLRCDWLTFGSNGEGVSGIIDDTGRHGEGGFGCRARLRTRMQIMAKCQF